MSCDSEPAPFAEGRQESGRTGVRGRRHRLRPLEWLTLAHVATFIITASWAFGGQAEWVRAPLTAWGCAGCLITLAAALNREPDVRVQTRLWLWAVPLVLFNVLVLVAATNPNFREVRDGVDTLLVPTGGEIGRPSSARPLLARRALIELDAIWISCFNLVLVIRRRRALRLLLSILAANALVLAVFGTAQKLSGAPGLFFGSVPSPQRFFFASFVYHNHWGAFMVLMIAVALGLTIHHHRRRTARDFFHSPAFLGLATVLILAASVPLSASRSSTLLVAALVGAALLHSLARIARARRQFNESIVPPLVVAAAAIVVGAAAIWHVAGPTITKRVALTVQQVEHARTHSGPDPRVQLYRDTWRMAAAKPWFGWGMASYPYVFMLYNTRESVDRLPVFYEDAHSDWLQAFAEHGAVGTSLLALCALVPLAASRRRFGESPLPTYVLAGCGMLLVYAWLEFPFCNFAVVLAWWACFFTAIQYTRLTAAKTADAPTRLAAASP